MAPSSHPTTRELHTSMGDLITEIEQRPEMAPLLTHHTQWSMNLDRVHIIVFGPTDAHLMDAVRDLLPDGEMRRHETTSSTGSSRPDSRRHGLAATWRNVPIEISMWLPEPTEREQLLARLAELDAAKGGVSHD